MPKNRRPKSKLLAISLLLLVGGVTWWILSTMSSLSSPVDPQGQPQAFTVQNGESISQVASGLENQHLIRSASAFKSAILNKDPKAQIQVGTYEVSPAQPLDQIVATFLHTSSSRWVTLLEGWRDEEMADKLNQALGIKQSDFLATAKEGYMFPDTYQFGRDVKVSDVTQKLEDNFERKFDPSLQAEVKNLGLTSDQAVILASIVERESRSDQARQMVASILLKRLKMGMVLNADSTIQYALGYQKDEQSWWKRDLSLDDLKVDSPFNTYIHAGLPPHPICNPSLSSLKAVASADPSTPYLYYYDDSSGVAHYAKTLDEQNANVAKYP